MLDSVPESLRLLLESVKDAGVNVKLLLLDGKFFSTEIIGLLQECDVSFLVPCRNTSNVVATLRELAYVDQNDSTEDGLQARGAGSIDTGAKAASMMIWQVHFA